ncbi:MAG: hypothetical protein KC713_05585 [Candidatus Omnitrophica bacterium]|nr:hypothetical protein [Candidatus Omnitrophota bacterium]
MIKQPLNLQNRIFLILTLSISLLTAIFLARETYYINYWPSDSWHLYIPAAKYTQDLTFISNIHKQNIFHSLHFKEILVLWVSFFQWLLNDFHSLFPNIIILIISNSVSGLMIYLILKKWLDPSVSFIGFLLFTGCLWPHLYMLLGAHQPLVMMNFLLAVFCLCYINTPWLACVISGICFGLAVFSSPTSPLYIPYYFFAFLLFIFHARLISAKNIFQSAGMIFVGACIVVLMITLPDPWKNTIDYFKFLAESQSENNFTHPNFIGVTAPDNLPQRGSGISWIIKYMFHTFPGLFSLYICSIFLCLYFSNKKWLAFIIVLFSLSTPVGAETVQAAQFGRNYFSWLFGIIVVCCLNLQNIKKLIQQKAPSQSSFLFSCLTLCVIGSILILNIQKLFHDIIPSRMATNHIHDFIRALPENEIVSVYKNHPYNRNIIGHINNPKYDHQMRFRFVNTVSDVKEGYFLLPPLTGKSIWSDCQRRDFVEDPHLNQLLQSGTFPEYVIKTFPTIASSQYWIHEEEYCTYLDLELRQVSSADRVFGQAFILKFGKNGR